MKVSAVMIRGTLTYGSCLTSFITDSMRNHSASEKEFIDKLNEVIPTVLLQLIQRCIIRQSEVLNISFLQNVVGDRNK